MQQKILIISVLFPAILLMMVNFTSRNTVLANLIRKLHHDVIRDNISSQDAERFLLQINQLCDPLRLIGFVQSRATMAFLLAFTAMIAVYFDENAFANMLFLGSITLLIISTLRFTREIHIANTALDVHLLELQTHQEWQQYLWPKHRRRVKANKKAWPQNA